MTTRIDIPTLETERLKLRCPRLDDFDAYAAFRGSDRAAHVGGTNVRAEAFDKLAGIVGHWQLRGYGRWLVADRATDEPLGIVGPMFPEGWPEPELAWSLFENAEGRGIAYEAALAARTYTYDVLGWTAPISCIATGNTRSVALAKRLGAAFERIFKHPTFGPLEVYRHPAQGAAA